MITVDINNQQTQLEIQPERLQAAVRAVLRGENVEVATVSIAVVDDATIQELNRRYLEHDYATDVLSFLLEPNSAQLEGEVIVSADTAVRQCDRYGWSAQDELLLYTIHGALHLVGYDDQGPQQTGRMRRRERFYLNQLGVTADERTLNPEP